MNPLLFMDIDGTMVPNVRHDLPPDGNFKLLRIPLFKNIFKHLIHTSVADAIPEMEKLFDWHWCTWWMNEANTRFGHALGMHEHPVVHLIEDRTHAWGKWDAVQAMAENRPLAWCDDQEIPAEAHAWAEVRNAMGIPTLLIKTNPQYGLADEHVLALLEFGRAHGTPRDVMPPLAKADKRHRAKSKPRFI